MWLFKYFTKLLLDETNRAAIRENRNRCIDPNIIFNLESNYYYLIQSYFTHTKGEIRLEIFLNSERYFLDISILRYESLPNGIYLKKRDLYWFENLEHANQRRPYPNSREWSERTLRQPVRKQTKFRDQVLIAYNHCCSVCGIDEPKLLRAAHIRDVKYGGIDSIENAICFCVNHEVAFDKGLFKIHEDFSTSPIINSANLNIQPKLTLPSKLSHRPSIKNIRFKNQKLNL